MITAWKRRAGWMRVHEARQQIAKEQEMWIICDIDGTLADITHRLHWIKEPKAPAAYEHWKPDWDSFNAAMALDQPKRDVITVLQVLGHDRKVMLVTGRFNQFQRVTEDWLDRNGVSWDELHMRSDGDYRSDHIIKEDIYLAHIKAKHRPVLCVIDDRQQVVDMWRSKGLTVLQCQKGDY